MWLCWPSERKPPKSSSLSTMAAETASAAEKPADELEVEVEAEVEAEAEARLKSPLLLLLLLFSESDIVVVVAECHQKSVC